MDMDMDMDMDMHMDMDMDMDMWEAAGHFLPRRFEAGPCGLAQLVRDRLHLVESLAA